MPSQVVIGRAIVVGSVLGIVAVVATAILDYRARRPPPDLGDTCCTAGAAPRRAPRAQVPATLQGGDPGHGAPLYLVACASWHDEDGSGRLGRAQYPKLPALRAALTSSVVGEVIVHGRAAMPAFGGLLDDRDVRDVVAHVAALAR